MMEAKDNCSVQVAVRVRPLVETESNRGYKEVLEIYSDLKQIRIKNSDKAFTYNHVFDVNTDQQDFYSTCIQSLIDNLFKGYNVTVLAYGQTGSGKTHSMGTAYTGEEEPGVIPRALHDIFNYVKDNFAYDFMITVSFIELYQETLYDLLANKPRDQCAVEIREDNRAIIIPGLTELPVTSATTALNYLSQGSLGRATGSTNMNKQSSRSHAIFTINISMQKKDDSTMNKTAKFHLVDLAGSERSKKTGAVGQTFKEGVNINKGLLALGNVISALGDEKQQQGYISYRDSNLTRLLKDSLGGNSITLMIACVSPVDYNLEETLSTLRYADRARKIKNKPVVNQDPKAAEINRLNKIIQQLRLELIGQGGPIICQAEIEQMRKETLTLKGKNSEMTVQLSTFLNDNTRLHEKILLIQNANELISSKLLELKQEYSTALEHHIKNLEENDCNKIQESILKLKSIQLCFAEMHTEQMKNDNEIHQHEVRFALRYSNVSSNKDSTRLSSECELSAQQESHTAQQIALNAELQDVTERLAMKEDLARKIAENTYHMIDYNAVLETESKIAALQKEKEELLVQLKTVQVHDVTNATSKVSEQRRKRVQELEKQLQDLHKKVAEQARLIKLKEKDEQKIRTLNDDIQSMKHVKVKLIRSMRQESEKFRTWKSEREREVLKLKEQERKRQNQIIKMEAMHSKMQNVLKRKVEEAAAVNKRLKDALAVRKTAQDQKSNKIVRVDHWIQQEFNILLSTVDAEITLAGLVDDRATLQEQLNRLKSNPDAGSEEMKQLEDEIELRSVQIEDMQHKILDSNQEGRAKTRWDNIQSMADAKHALKTLFELTADVKRKEANHEVQVNELSNVKEELNSRIIKLEKRIRMLEGEHNQQIAVAQKEYEEKVGVLLRQLRGVQVESMDEEYKERCSIQQQAIDMLESINEKLMAQNRELKENISEINTVAAQNKTPINKVTKLENNAQDSPDLINCTFTKPNVKENKDPGMDSSIDNDDTEADPDWRKTPLYKRVIYIRGEAHAQNERLTVKRSSDGGCACRGNCSKRHCGCKKLSLFCGSNCKCSVECVNKEDNSQNNLTESSITDEESFKRPSTYPVSKRQFSLSSSSRFWINNFLTEHQN